MSEPLYQLDRIISQLEQSYRNDTARLNRPVASLKVIDNVESIWSDSSHDFLFKNKAFDGAAISLTLLEVFLRISLQLKSLLSAVPENYNVHADSFAHARTKRELLGALSLGIGLFFIFI